MPEALRVTVIHSLEDIRPLPSLRREDRVEVTRNGGTVEGALHASIRGSTQSFAVYVEGHLMCVWGYRRCGPAADVWLLTTEAVDKHPFAFIRESRRLLKVLQANFTTLRCEVDADYNKTRKWLHRIGFKDVRDGVQAGFIVYEIGGADGRAS